MKIEKKEEIKLDELSEGVRRVITILRTQNEEKDRFIRRALTSNTVFGQVRILVALIKYKFTKKWK